VLVENVLLRVDGFDATVVSDIEVRRVNVGVAFMTVIFEI